MTSKKETNEYVNLPNILISTLAEFIDGNYLKEVLANEKHRKMKVSVIEAPSEWFHLHSNKKYINYQCKEIQIKKLITQKFTKISDTGASLSKSGKLRQRKIYSVTDYKRLITDTGSNTSRVDWDKKYWKFLNDNNPIALHAGDVDFSFFEKYQGNKQWNLKEFKGLISRIKDENGEKVPGVHTLYSYLGSEYLTFPSRVEDGYFLSIDIHYNGANKIWFVVDIIHSVRFQTLVNEKMQETLPAGTICSDLHMSKF